MKLCMRTITVDSVEVALRDLDRSYNSSEVDFPTRIVTVGDGDSVPSGYVEISDIKGWNGWGILAQDDGCIDTEITTLYAATDWASLDADEQKIVCNRFIAEDANLTTHYSDKKTEATAREAYEEQLITCRQNRYDLAQTEIKYQFSIADVATVAGEIIDDNLEEKYINHGIETLFDYIQGENSYDGGGLANKVFTVRDGNIAGVVTNVMSALETGKI